MFNVVKTIIIKFNILQIDWARQKKRSQFEKKIRTKKLPKMISVIKKMLKRFMLVTGFTYSDNSIINYTYA